MPVVAINSRDVDTTGMVDATGMDGYGQMVAYVIPGPAGQIYS